MGHEGVGEGGEGVFDSGWYFGVDVARDKARGFEIFKGLGEHFGRDVGDGTADGVEACGLVFGEHTQYEHRPFAGEA